MQHVKLGLIATAITVLATCAPTDSTDTRSAPKPTTIDTVVSSDVDATWNGLISGLKGREFEINALEKGDRTIRLLLQSQSPSRYVDCGEISVRSKHPEFGERNYNFPAANSARYLVADDRVDQLVDVERRTALNVLAVVHLTPQGSGTLISVDANYVMSFRTREFGNGISPRNLDDSLNFKSVGSARLDEQIREGASTKTVTVECRPTGELERRIVAVLGNRTG